MTGLSNQQSAGWAVVAEFQAAPGVGGVEPMAAPPDPGLDRIARLAAELLDADLARIALREPATGPVGRAKAAEPGLEPAFGARIIEAPDDGVLVIPDILDDPVGGPSAVAASTVIPFRFLAGASVRVGGEQVGTLLVAGQRPRTGLGQVECRRLRDLAGLATSLLSARHEAAVQRKAAEGSHLMQRELNHRVRNTLAVLQSIAGQTLSNTSDPEAFMRSFTGRMRAMAEAHTLLSEREWGAVRLRTLIRRLVAPFASDPPRQLDIDGTDVGIPPDPAIGLASALHELATNAATHGSLTVPSGKVAITWTIEPGEVPTLHLGWRESGGPTVSAPQRSRFGSVLIRHSLDKILASRVMLHYSATGVVAAFSVPLNVPSP